MISPHEFSGLEEPGLGPRKPDPQPGCRVLLASSNPIEQKLTVGLLGKQGYRVAIAASGPEAIRQVATEEWDVVLVDGGMICEAGDELCRSLRGPLHVAPRRPILLVLGDESQRHDACQAWCADGFLDKPIRAEDFAACLCEARRSFAAPRDPTVSPNAVAWRTALEFVGGQRELLTEIIEIFFQEYPPALEEIRASIERRDAKALQLFAHRLKGCLRYFGAAAAVGRARRLEELGKQGSFDLALPELRHLEAEIDQLLPALRRGPAEPLD